MEGSCACGRGDNMFTTVRKCMSHSPCFRDSNRLHVTACVRVTGLLADAALALLRKSRMGTHDFVFLTSSEVVLTLLVQTSRVCAGP